MKEAFYVKPDLSCFGKGKHHTGPCPGYACVYLNDCIMEYQADSAVILEEEHDDRPECLATWKSMRRALRLQEHDNYPECFGEFGWLYACRGQRGDTVCPYANECNLETNAKNCVAIYDEETR